MAIFPNIKVSGINFEPPEVIKNTLIFSDGNRQELYFLPGLYNAKLTLLLDFINENEVSELLRFWDTVGGMSGTFTLPDSIFTQPNIIKSFINYPNLYWKFDEQITIDTIVATSVRSLWKTQVRLSSVVSQITIENLVIYSPLPIDNMNNVFFCETISVQDYEAPITINNLNVLYNEHVISYTTGSIFRFENGAWTTYTPENGTIYIHRSNETCYQYIDGNMRMYINSNFIYPVNIQNTTAATSSDTGALKIAGGLGVSGSIFSKNIDLSGHAEFSVGGISTTFYPVRFQLIQPSALAGSGRIQIYRSDLSIPNLPSGTFNLEFDFTPRNFGNQISRIDAIEYDFFNSASTLSNAVADIVDGSTSSGNSDFIVWLRGNLPYHIRTLNPGQYIKVLNRNASGTSIQDSSGVTHQPRTTQSDLILNVNWRSLTPLNGWFNAGSGYQTLRAIKKPDDTIEIQGLLSINSVPSLNTVIFNLPSGMRPAANLLFFNTAGTNNNEGTFDFTIQSNGDVLFQGTDFSLSGMTYLTVSVNVNFSVKP